MRREGQIGLLSAGPTSAGPAPSTPGLRLPVGRHAVGALGPTGPGPETRRPPAGGEGVEVVGTPGGPPLIFLVDRLILVVPPGARTPVVPVGSVVAVPLPRGPPETPRPAHREAAAAPTATSYEAAPRPGRRHGAATRGDTARLDTPSARRQMQKGQQGAGDSLVLIEFLNNEW